MIGEGSFATFSSPSSSSALSLAAAVAAES